MSESSSQEKTEQPTEKRLRDARKRGQIPRSRELTTAAVVAAAAALLMSQGGSTVDDAAMLMRATLSFDAQTLEDPTQLPTRLLATLKAGLWSALPFFIGTFVAALAAPMLLGGWNFSTEAATPKLDRLNPVTGLGRIFSSNSLMELVKSLAKFFLLAFIATLFGWLYLGELVGLSSEPAHHGMAHGVALCLSAFAWLCGGLLIIAAIDVPWQLWSHNKSLRMTKQEIREEHKELEGKPEVKAKIRRLQHEMANRRMMEKVPKADVVIVNPTHYAVALQYSADKMRAPQVVAKGVDVIALAIRELAQQNNVPIVEAPPLARALYRKADLDGEIPITLYAAVAQVLTYVYQLKNGLKATPPKVGDVPDGEVDDPAS